MAAQAQVLAAQCALHALERAKQAAALASTEAAAAAKQAAASSSSEAAAAQRTVGKRRRVTKVQKLAPVPPATPLPPSAPSEVSIFEALFQVAGAPTEPACGTCGTDRSARSHKRKHKREHKRGDSRHGPGRAPLTCISCWGEILIVPSIVGIGMRSTPQGGRDERSCGTGLGDRSCGSGFDAALDSCSHCRGCLRPGACSRCCGWSPVRRQGECSSTGASCAQGECSSIGACCAHGACSSTGACCAQGECSSTGAYCAHSCRTESEGRCGSGVVTSTIIADFEVAPGCLPAVHSCLEEQTASGCGGRPSSDGQAGRVPDLDRERAGHECNRTNLHASPFDGGDDRHGNKDGLEG